MSDIKDTLNATGGYREIVLGQQDWVPIGKLRDGSAVKVEAVSLTGNDLDAWTVYAWKPAPDVAARLGWSRPSLGQPNDDVEWSPTDDGILRVRRKSSTGAAPSIRITRFEVLRGQLDVYVDCVDPRQAIVAESLAYFTFPNATIDGSPFHRRAENVRGTFTKNRFEVAASAISFNADTKAHVLVRESDFTNVSSAISVGAWIRPIFYDYGLHGGGVILGKHYTHKQRSYILYYEGRDMLTFELNDPQDHEYFVKSPLQQDEKWHPVVATYDARTMCLYVDGKLAHAEQVPSFPVMQSAIPLTLGCYHDSSDSSVLRGFFNGDVDEVFVLPRALSPGEVASLYKGP
jgi:hypothetical protein